MVLFLRIFLIAVVTVIGIGFYYKTDDPATGDLLIGLALVAGFFVLMPLFIYHRYNGRDLQRYMLNKENIERMRAFQNGEDEEE